MKYKLVVSDFDFTIYRTDHTIAKETLDTIKEYERRGGRFVICTGRMTSPALEKFKNYGFGGYVIGYQGGEVMEYDGKVLHSNYLDEESVEICLNELDRLGYYVQIYNHGTMYVNRRIKITDYYAAENAIDINVVEGSLLNYVRRNKLKLNKILFALSDDMDSITEEKQFACIEVLNKVFKNVVMYNTANLKLIEVISDKQNKGKAVKWLADKLGIKRDEIICMGDACNDISMVEYAGLGVAVGNADKRLKEVADLVTVTCDENAVGKVIEKYCL